MSKARTGPWISSSDLDFSKPVELLKEGNRPEQYHEFDEQSALAIVAALGARRPLLVRGKPGVGKTQLAAAAAKVLRRPLVSHVVDSRTEARDLLWEFDAVMRLAEAQIAAAVGPALDPPFVNEHGVASNDSRSRRVKLQDDLSVRRFLRPGPLWWAFDWNDAKEQAKVSGSPVPAADPEVDPENGCVVLIDEIDKADTDVPNGLLEALGSGEFATLGSNNPVKVVGKPPLVIITTNEERVLPNAFLRRCLVLRLSLPEADHELITFLIKRAELHFPRHAKIDGYEGLFQKAAALLVRDRIDARERSIEPLPGQAEYLDLIRAVLDLKPDSIESHLEILDKVAEFTFKKHETIGT
jgi:MoxR-like ATPase